MELVSYDWWLFFVRWCHILSGVMWIGHLWYFNFTQTPTVPKIPTEMRPAVTKFILPEALFWFRWGAMGTIIFGLILAYMNQYLGSAIKLGIGDHSAHNTTIGFGMWLGTIMWFNVWFIIWPGQKKNIGLVQATPDEVKKATRLAGLASRVNTMLSIPMLYCMAGVHFYY
jgi:uncharacterized membrane protein